MTRRETYRQRHRGDPVLIELTCRKCGELYVPTRDDFRRGPEVYHRCPTCRPPVVDDDPGVVT